MEVYQIQQDMVNHEPTNRLHPTLLVLRPIIYHTIGIPIMLTSYKRLVSTLVGNFYFINDNPFCYANSLQDLLSKMDFPSSIFVFILFILSLFSFSVEQQPYVRETTTDCPNKHNESSALGYFCNGVSKSCHTYLTFRSITPYNNITSISNLLAADPLRSPKSIRFWRLQRLTRTSWW